VQTVFTIRTSGPGLYEFTDDVSAFVRSSALRAGLLTLFVRHTSCSLCVQENADPDVRRDLDEFFRRLVPSGDDPSMNWLTQASWTRLIELHGNVEQRRLRRGDAN
jgi:secondary thiamine-phosphate synthase enzyme